MPLADSHRGSSGGFESLSAISAIKELFGDLLRNWPQKKTKKKNPRKRATSPSDHADAPLDGSLMAAGVRLALFRDPPAPLKDTPKSSTGAGARLGRVLRHRF